MRANTMQSPTIFRSSIAIHCPSCHRNTWATAWENGRAVCVECRATMIVSSCIWHDRKIADAESILDRERLVVDDPRCSDPECDREWTVDQIMALPFGHLTTPDGSHGWCPTCPAEWIVTTCDPTGVISYYQGPGEWTLRAQDARRYETPEEAYRWALACDAQVGMWLHGYPL